MVWLSREIRHLKLSRLVVQRTWLETLRLLLTVFLSVGRLLPACLCLLAVDCLGKVGAGAENLNCSFCVPSGFLFWSPGLQLREKVPKPRLLWNTVPNFWRPKVLSPVWWVKPVSFQQGVNLKYLSPWMECMLCSLLFISYSINVCLCLFERPLLSCLAGTSAFDEHWPLASPPGAAHCSSGPPVHAHCSSCSLLSQESSISAHVLNPSQ